MSDRLDEAFNEQITVALPSLLAYLHLSAYFDAQDLMGMASWMKRQSLKDREHALRFHELVVNRGNEVRLGSIETHRGGFESVEQVFDISLQQEREVTTEAIHAPYRQETEDGDLAGFSFLKTFVEEKNEEEAMVKTILDWGRLAGGELSAMLRLDSELGARV